MGRKAKTAVSSLRGAAIITAADVGLAGLGAFVLPLDFLASLGLVMLLESAALMLLGGALNFSGWPGVRKLTSLLTQTGAKVTGSDLTDLEAKAATYALVGALLFVESLALAAATA